MQTHNYNMHIYSYIPYLSDNQEKERGSLEVKLAGPNISLVGGLALNVDLICDDSALASWTQGYLHRLDQ